MPSYSNASKGRLLQASDNLQDVFNSVIKIFDCTILQGHRSEEMQNEYEALGRSQVRWPNSKHNSFPSMAVDACPYPYDPEDRERITLFAGVVLGIASSRNIKLRWGGDWNQDTEVKDNSFDDLFHFEEVGFRLPVSS